MRLIVNKKFLLITVLLIILTGVLNYAISSTGILRKIDQQTKATPTTTQLSQIECSKKPLSNVTEGPYYTANTPQKNDLTEEGIIGERLILTGYVVDEECRPISNAWLDFWQADGNGEYDNTGYRLRGHQFTDADGKYRLVTVIPGEYPGRTPHIHVKVRPTQSSPVITSQIFFPDTSLNAGDFVYDKSLEVRWVNSEPIREAAYTFVIEN